MKGHGRLLVIVCVAFLVSGCCKGCKGGGKKKGKMQQGQGDAQAKGQGEERGKGAAAGNEALVGGGGSDDADVSEFITKARELQRALAEPGPATQVSPEDSLARLLEQLMPPDAAAPPDPAPARAAAPEVLSADVIAALGPRVYDRPARLPPSLDQPLRKSLNSPFFRSGHDRAR